MLSDLDFEKHIADITDDRELLLFVARQTFRMSQTCIDCQAQTRQHTERLDQHEDKLENGSRIFGDLQRDMKKLQALQCATRRLAPARWWGVMIGTAVAIIISAYTLIGRYFPRIGP